VSVTITLIDYRAGNMASVRKAFEHLGVTVVVTSDPMDVCRAEKIVLPGVGHFSATRTIDEFALRNQILEAVKAGVPFLGICVGMQWMYDGSTEAPDVLGAGLISGLCDVFPVGVKSPHVGWNTITKTKDSRILAGVNDDAFVYFTHSYREPVTLECVATTQYGGSFAAAVECNNIFGTQFHPEKSGDVGLKVLQNFIAI
jgi:glutamine amidotransferase